MYTFDHVAGPQSTQNEMMKCIGKPITDKVLEGYNGTIFAYGQTGSGKTYTMSGEVTHHYGLMPNIFIYLFKQIEKKQSIDSEYSVKVTCCELYNDNISDLLQSKHPSLSIREDVRKKRFFVKGLLEKECKSAQEMFNYVGIARWFRKTKATKMNSTSSRSHLLFTVILTKRTKNTECDDPTKMVQSTISRLNLVDLAGSERQRRTGSKGARFKESKFINASLTELGRVISSLVTKERHIPYNNSKLTKLLKDSLGGNALTFMVANISPSVEDQSESLSTLQFADRAKRIKNTATRNDRVHLSLNALKEQNSKFVEMVEELAAKYESVQKKFKMQRRKSVELSSKLDVVNKENCDLQSAVSSLKSQRELALEMSAKVMKEQEAQIEALQRKLADKSTMHRSFTDITDHRVVSNQRFPFNSPPRHKKMVQHQNQMSRRSISSPVRARMDMGYALSTITTRLKSNENSSICNMNGNNSYDQYHDARSSCNLENMEKDSMIITLGGGNDDHDHDDKSRYSMQHRTSSEAINEIDLEQEMIFASRHVDDTPVSPQLESGEMKMFNMNQNRQSVLSYKSILGSEEFGSEDWK